METPGLDIVRNVGVGQEGVRKIPTDDVFRMRPDALQKAIEEDIAAGWQPFCVVATVGTTSITSEEQKRSSAPSQPERRLDVQSVKMISSSCP